MSNLEIEHGIGTFVDRRTGVETAVVGVLSAQEFAWAQTVLPDLNNYADYQDWLNSREDLQMGLAMAGVDTKIATVALSTFLTWCRSSCVLPSERSLDAFAAVSANLRDASGALAFARRDDFESHPEIAAFAPYESYDAWLRHRETARRKGSSQIKELSIHVGDFVAWSQCLGQTASETSLDAYATLLLEFLTSDAEA